MKEQLKHQPVSLFSTLKTGEEGLLKVLAGAEADLQESCSIKGRRVKLVEQGGIMLRKLPVKVSIKCPCPRPSFTACSGETFNSGDCKTRNHVYEKICMRCQDEGVINDEKFLLFYDLNRSDNLAFPYDSYSAFDFDDLQDECLSEFRFYKNKLLGKKHATLGLFSAFSTNSPEFIHTAKMY